MCDMLPNLIRNVQLQWPMQLLLLLRLHHPATHIQLPKEMHRLLQTPQVQQQSIILLPI